MDCQEQPGADREGGERDSDAAHACEHAPSGHEGVPTDEMGETGGDFQHGFQPRLRGVSNKTRFHRVRAEEQGCSTAVAAMFKVGDSESVRLDADRRCVAPTAVEPSAVNCLREGGAIPGFAFPHRSSLARDVPDQIDEVEQGTQRGGDCQYPTVSESW